jgi:hypothetical protein
VKRHLIAAAALLSINAHAGVVGGPADGMCPAVTEHGPCINKTNDPPGVAPYTTPRIATTTDQPGGPGSVSAARWICKRVGYSHNDFLVWPNKDDATHKHVHWGVDYRGSAVKTADELALLPTTCQGGTGFDTSAMWAPVVVDTSTMTIVAEEQFMKYYKSGYNGILPHQLRTIPNGFTMITGSASNTEKKGPVQHKCDGVDPATGLPTPPQQSQEIPNCPVGTRMVTEIPFPQCVAVDADGNPLLDSPNHKDHVSFTVQRPDLPASELRYGKWCPTTHPYPIPEVRFVITYPKVTVQDQMKNWRLSSDMYWKDANGNVIPGGRTGHADYVKSINSWAWDSIMLNLQGGFDLHGHLIGNGWKTF